jgi:pimeloyl-ACP methyl ester carboxylesterase
MKKNLTWLLCGIFYITQVWAQDAVPAIEFTGCFLEDCTPFANDASLQYAYLTVPEDYSRPEGRSLRLAVMVIKSSSGNSLPDPIIYLRGGPGYTVFLKDLINMFLTHPLRQNRDIIILDFRGIGLSEPAFVPEHQTNLVNLILSDLTPEKATEKHLIHLEESFGTLLDKGVNLNMYNSAAVVKDLELLRKSMGIDQWNLWGISYGTRVAQTYMRDFPQAVRCAIMDSPVPMGYPSTGEEIVLYRNSLNRFFASCNDNPGCNSAFPELEKRFYSAMESLKSNPVVFPYYNAPGGTACLNFQDVHLIFQQLLYEPRFYPLIPWLVKAVEDRNTMVFKNLFQLMESEFYTYSEVMYLTVMKYDGGLSMNDYKIPVDDPLRNALNYFDNRDHMLQRIDYMIQDTLEALPVISNIPSLILAGSIDPVTPPAYAQILQKSFTQSYLFEFPGRGHGLTRNTDCAKKMAVDFVNNPAVIPDSECITTTAASAISWVNGIYQNARMVSLTNQLLVQKQWIHMAGAALLLISFLISTGVVMISFFHKKDIHAVTQLRNRNLITSLTTMVSLFFIAGVVWFIIKTVNTSGPLLIAGLSGDAAPLFFVSIIVLAGTILSWFMYFRSLRQSSAGGKIIYGLMNLSLLWVCVLIIQFQLFP